MTLLLDAEARLFFVPEAPVQDRAPATARAPVAAVAETASLPAPVTWAGTNEQSRTLDDLLSDTWDGLSSGSSVAACPVCDGELVRRWSAGAGVVGGRCRDCGSELS